MGTESNGLNGDAEHFDYATPEGKRFLVGYRKFIVAMLWMVLMAFGVVMVLLFEDKPSAGQVTIVVWLIVGCGFFSAFFVGGNVLAKLWAQNYKVSTTSSLSHATEQVEKTVKVITVDSNEDASFADDKNSLPAAKPRKRS